MTERLTNRERQILELAARHLTSKQIGPRLGIRPASVDTFMQAIIRKLGVASRKEAVIAYMAWRPSEVGGRDDLDFGSSPVDRPGGAVLAREVTETHDPERPFLANTAWLVGQIADTPSGLPKQAKIQRDLAFQRLLSSPARRLVAIAIAALVLGLVTLAAVAIGYGLNQTFDRALGAHSAHPAG